MGANTAFRQRLCAITCLLNSFNRLMNADNENLATAWNTYLNKKTGLEALQAC